MRNFQGITFIGTQRCISVPLTCTNKKLSSFDQNSTLHHAMTNNVVLVQVLQQLPVVKEMLSRETESPP